MWPFSGGVSFTASDIPSLEGKVILVTGGNSGLGKQSVLEFARHGAKEIWLASRSTEKSDEAIADIKKEVPDANIKPLSLDLNSLESVRNAARTFTQSSEQLDILMLNAGIMAAPAGLTKDGYELQFGTNHVGHAPLPGSDVRVVVLTSAGAAMAPTGGIQFDSLKTKAEEMATWTRYGQSKLANALFARQLAREHPSWTTAAVHPGVISTNLGQHVRNMHWVFGTLLSVARLVLTTVEAGTRNQLWAATAPRGEIKSGEMYFPVGDLTGGRRGPYYNDDALAKKLWDWTEGEFEGQSI
jgi:NAD(P)-dependent dehydrogenase (short-subunit alcohol dehydrogenase family)